MGHALQNILFYNFEKSFHSAVVKWVSGKYGKNYVIYYEEEDKIKVALITVLIANQSFLNVIMT